MTKEKLRTTPPEVGMENRCNRCDQIMMKQEKKKKRILIIVVIFFTWF